MDPDVLVLAGIDWDHELHAIRALRDRMQGYAHVFAPQPNSGLDTRLDLDGDGWRRGARDAQGFGEFTGQGGLAILSRLPIAGHNDHSAYLWRDLPGTLIAESDPAWETQRLSSVAHWTVTLEAPGGPITIMTYHATPPVFDGPEDRNGRRNHDETLFWVHLLDGTFGPAPSHRFILLGDANLDPVDGDGRSEAMRALLSHPHLQDPKPRSDWAALAAGTEGGANTRHRGDPALDTANWRDGPDDPGNLRVDYVLPSADWIVEGSGVHWALGEEGLRLRHGLVWVDLRTSGSPGG